MTQAEDRIQIKRALVSVYQDNQYTTLLLLGYPSHCASPARGRAAPRPPGHGGRVPVAPPAAAGTPGTGFPPRPAPC